MTKCIDVEKKPSQERPQLPPSCSIGGGPEPDAVAAARCIINGVEPPHILWNLKPNCRVLEQGEASLDTYVRSRSYLEDFPWPIEYLTTSSPTFFIEQAIGTDPTFEAKAIEHALLDCLRLLNFVVEDGLRQTHSPLDGSQVVTRNSRLRNRLALAVHDEIGELLNDWNRISERSLFDGNGQ